jgi:hypothetical protein
MQDLHRFASLGVKVAITGADVRTFVETTDSTQQPTDKLAVFPPPILGTWTGQVLFVRSTELAPRRDTWQ